MSGFGLQPAGTSSAGFGQPAPAHVQTGSTLFDAATRTSTGARYIDPRTKDYQLNANGRLDGMGAVQQVVVLAISTDKGSSAVRSLGHQLRGIDRITSNFRARCLGVLTAALKPAVDQRLIEVLGFDTFRAGPADGLQPGQTYGRLQWRDLTTGLAHTETI